MFQRLNVRLNPGTAGCGKFAAKPLVALFKIYSQSINPKREISKLLTFPDLESGDKNIPKFYFRFT